MAMGEGLGVTPIYNIDRGQESGMFGGNGMWIFFLFFLLAWGGNGLGGFGGARGAEAGMISNDFMYSNLSSQLRDNAIQNSNILNSIQQGLSTIGYQNLDNARGTQMQIANGFSTTQSELMGGFNGIQNTLLQGFAGLNQSMSDCCCTTQKELLINRYEAEKNTSAIIQAIHADGEATRGLVTQNTIQDLRDRLTESQLNASQCYQNAFLVNAIRPYPVPSYPACPVMPPFPAPVVQA